MRWPRRPGRSFFGGSAPLAPPINTVAPVISGTLGLGDTLTATNGTWTGSPTFTYQWKRGGVNIGGATASTYVLTSTDFGTAITCAVTGTNTTGSATATSNTLSPEFLLSPIFRFDARSLVLADGAKVAAWASDVGAAALAQSTEARKPVYRASVSSLNNKPAVEFQSANTQHMVFSNVAEAANNWTWYAVIDQTSVGAGQRLVDLNGADRLTLEAATQVAYFEGGAAKNLGAAATGAQTLAWLMQSAASGTGYRGRTQLASGLAYTQRALSITISNRLGATIGDALHWDGQLAMLTVYAGIHTADQRAAMWNGIHAIWGTAAP